MCPLRLWTRLQPQSPRNALRAGLVNQRVQDQVPSLDFYPSTLRKCTMSPSPQRASASPEENPVARVAGGGIGSPKSRGTELQDSSTTHFLCDTGQTSTLSAP